MLKTACFALAAIFADSTVAQSAARPDPANSRAAVPARPYESAFKDYRPYADPEAARWRQSNEELGSLGGHAGHVRREAGATAKPAAKPSAPAGHGGHK
jgi:hypothetical protein